MKKIEKLIHLFFKRTSYVFIFCLIFLTLSLVTDGTLFQIVRLNRDIRVLRNRITLFENKNEMIKKQIEESSKTQFIEKEAMERLDFVHEEDLIFIFPEEI